MELIYKVKKPETIKSFLKENSIPFRILVQEDGKPQIFLNKSLKQFKDTVKKGDHLHILIQNEKLEEITPEKEPLDVVYEDDYLLIVNKPAEIQIMVTKSHSSNTLANRLQQYYIDHNIHSQMHFINRLDKESSGLILIAKNRFIKYLLKNVFEDQMVREYYAIVDGNFPLDEYSINLPISRQDQSYLREISENGEECVTSYKVLKTNDRYSLIKVLNETNRTHQIRVHFAYFNSPIVGDTLYSNFKYHQSEFMLFSYHIAFEHPITGDMVDVSLPLPVHMDINKIQRK